MFLVSCIIVVIILLVLFNRQSSGFNDIKKEGSRIPDGEPRIPKKIWTFWDVQPIPDFINKCIDTWRKENPDFEITVISKENLSDYVGQEESDAILNWKFNNSPQKLSDLIRLSILSKYGGIWLDASIVAYSSFDWVIDDGASCIMFSIPEISEEPTLESWFIACTQNNTFITQWNDEFRRVDQFDTIDDYVNDVNVNLEGIGFNDYLLVYISCRKILRQNPSAVKIMSASTGPYVYHVNGGVSTLCAKKPKHFIKMRKEDRASVKEAGENVETCIFDKNIGEIQNE